MELAKVEIRLGGSLANTTIRKNVTPAELTVMREIHGDECISSIEYTGEDKKREDFDELERIRQHYNTKNVAGVVNRLFPGMAPQLPKTFKAVGCMITREGEIKNRKRLADEHASELERKVREAAIERTGSDDGVVTVQY